MYVMGWLIVCMSLGRTCKEAHTCTCVPICTFEGTYVCVLVSVLTLCVDCDGGC